MLHWMSLNIVFIEHYMSSYAQMLIVGNQIRQSMFDLSLLLKSQSILYKCFVIIFSTIKVLRCQLPRENKFYDFDPSNEETASVSFLF